MPHVPAAAQQLALIRAGHRPTIRRVRAAMRRAGGVAEAAEELGIGRRTLERWLREPCFDDIPRDRPGRKPGVSGGSEESTEGVSKGVA